MMGARPAEASLGYSFSPGPGMAQRSAMNGAIERLAAELMRLSDDEWMKARDRWAAGQGWDAVFGPAWEEISERLAEVDRSMRPPGEVENAR